MYRLLAFVLFAPAALWGQIGGAAPAGGSSTAAQLPLSGRAGQSGSVATADDSPGDGALCG
jgi:hypothetical protein